MSSENMLIHKYHKLGWLEKQYYTSKENLVSISSDDRLIIAERLYNDYVQWSNNFNIASTDYEKPKVDSNIYVQNDYSAERFRKAINKVSKDYLPVIYKIVLEETEIKPRVKYTTRDQLYFNDEIKILLCRGLDQMHKIYIKKFS